MVKLFYKECELGNLTFDKKTNEYVYNSNLEGEKKAKAKYLAMEFYSLSNSKDRRQKYIFDEFDQFRRSVTRADIVELADIKQEDSVFVRLEKMAKLDLLREEYSIKYSE